MVSVLCIFAVATRTLALVEGFGKNRNPLSPTVATRTLALVEGARQWHTHANSSLQLARWHWLKVSTTIALTRSLKVATRTLALVEGVCN